MICNSCFHQSLCEGQPNEKDRCHLYLEYGDIEFNEDISLNPIDLETFDDEDIERFFLNGSTDKSEEKKY